MTVFIVALVHETNTFSPLPTTRRSFSEGLLHQTGNAQTLAEAKQLVGYCDALAIAAAKGEHAICGPAALAQPAGTVPRQVYETLRDDLIADLVAAGPVDKVFLLLHGAMVAEGYADAEGDLLQKVRAATGPQVAIGALLDLHGNISRAMIESDAVLVAVKEYPHTDYSERAHELYAILDSIAADGPVPKTVLRRVPLLGTFGTTEPPMRAFVERMQAFEKEPGIRSVSTMHGFPWADTPHTSGCVIVVHDAEAAMRAEQIADELAAAFFALRLTVPARLPIDAAIDKALAELSPNGPVVIGDGADNPGGGAACDSTFVLEALLARGVENAALGMIWDPQAVEIAADAGVGARLSMRIGGKVGPMSGRPLDVEAEVLCVRDDAVQRSIDGKSGATLGAAVAIRVDGIDIVLNSTRQQVFTPDCFSEFGIDVGSKSIVVVKSTQHFRAGFDPIAAATIYCDAPGSLHGDLARLPYRRVRRPVWPLDRFDTPAVDDGVVR